MARTYERAIDKKRWLMTTACQYCAVGCGYRAVLLPKGVEPEELHNEIFPSYVSPAMRNHVRYRGRVYDAAVVPDARCDLNRGNHSVRGGSQGENLVTANGAGRSTKDRLVAPQVRAANGKLHPINWRVATRVVAGLTQYAAGVRWSKKKPGLIEACTPERLGVKIYEYQYLENTYAATKLFYRALGLPNVAYHDRPSAAGSSPGVSDAGFRPHDFAYEDVRAADCVFLVGSNPYENQSVFFMQNVTGKDLIVLDPRRTATAQYAVDTGGLHLQPTALGADSLVLYAIARALLQALPEDAIHPQVARSLGKEDRAKFVKDGKKPNNLRRASRALGLAEFKAWLDADGTYTLDNAANVSGIRKADLHEAVRRLSQPTKGSTELPIVALLYEKGLIWGFNYHNTAAVASLGLTLWRPRQPAPLTGRCGGHQKGWARADRPVAGFLTPDDKGYPFNSAGDRYDDARLRELAKELKPDSDPGNHWDGKGIRVHHNLDTHVFGPDPLMCEGKAAQDGRIQLANGVDTVAEPDVRLLWIIGGNYLGQTNNAQEKREKLQERRLGACGPNHGLLKGAWLALSRLGARGPNHGGLLKGAWLALCRLGVRGPNYPNIAGLEDDKVVDEILSKFTARMKSGGLVVIQQEILPNATTELADLVLPAAGWGEDDFVRYNAERRLRLYERFQDPPLHPCDEKNLCGRDPLEFRDDHDVIRFSPKADWVIFRDVARQLVCLMGANPAKNQEAVDCALQEFAWKTSAEVADEMAEKSNRAGMIGAIRAFAAGQGVQAGRLVHGTLGLGGEGNSKILADAYSVPGGSTVLGNGVAPNGLLLPVELGPMNEKGQPTLRGSLRRVPKAEERLNFVRADWSEICGWFAKLTPKDGEVALTCGRVNHLWNNLFHHVRNDYVAERYPEDLPGTILEVNPCWAKREGFANGDVVDVSNKEGAFRAVVSKQDSLAWGAAFAIFSYPVSNGKGGRFNFSGFANNVMNGYWDGINPIGALKYGRAKVEKVGGIPPFRSGIRRGPSYAQRNRIVALPVTDELRDGVDGQGRWSHPRRLDWRMRELIVAKGLPRAFVHSGIERQASLLAPDQTLYDLRQHLGSVFAMMLDVMKWPVPGRRDAGRYDVWDGVDLAFTRDQWGRSVEFEGHPTEPAASGVNTRNLECFVAWSEVLTGFDDLRNDLPHARSILRRLLQRNDDVPKRLMGLLRSFDLEFGRLTSESLSRACSDTKLAELTTILWYTGAFLHPTLGFPLDVGTLRDDHYRKGLIWRAARLQPFGYSTRLERWTKRP